MTSKKQQEEYLKKISKTEEQLHNITKENQKIQAELARLEEDVQRNVRQMQEINEKLARHGSPHARKLQEKLGRETREFQLFMSKQRESLQYTYKQNTEKLQEERLRLQKERRELSWD